MGPLSNWDIVSEGLNRRIALQQDLKKLEIISQNNNWISPITTFTNSLIWENKVIILTDSLLNIVYATENMFEMNGYTPDEVLGKKPKMFQGEKTEFAELKKLRQAIDNKKPFEGTLTNYKKNGSIYKCHIEEYPMFNKHHKLVNFLALENIL